MSDTSHQVRSRDYTSTPDASSVEAVLDSVGRESGLTKLSRDHGGELVVKASWEEDPTGITEVKKPMDSKARRICFLHIVSVVQQQVYKAPQVGHLAVYSGQGTLKSTRDRVNSSSIVMDVLDYLLLEVIDIR